MSKVGPPPTEWKSARWWQNRPVEERLAWAHIPPRWKDVKCEEWSDELDQFIDNFNPQVPGLLVTGPSGSGKTIVSIGLFKGLLRTHPISGRFVNSDRYVEMLKDQFDNDNQLPEMYAMPHLIKYLKGVFDVILLDGLGQERLTEFAQHELGSLLRQRYEDCRTTIITSSLTKNDLLRRYGERISGVLSEMPVLVMPKFMWKD